MQRSVTMYSDGRKILPGRGAGNYAIRLNRFIATLKAGATY